MALLASRKTKFGFALIVALIVAGFVVMAAQRWQQHGVVQGAVPERPDLADFPPALTDRVLAAEKAATGIFSSVEGLVELSRIYHANGNYAEAMQCYDGLREVDGGEARWYHLQANILAGFGMLEDAARLAEAAVEQDSGYLPAQLRLGDILTKLNRSEEALAVYRQVLAREPRNPYALLGLARAEVADENWPAAEQHLDEAIAANPDFVGGLSLMVMVQERLGNVPEANYRREQISGREFVDFSDPWADDLMEACFDPYRLSVAAAVAGFAGDQARARSYLERSILLDPDASSYRRQLGRLLTEMQDLAGARLALEQAVEVSPTDSDSWLLLIEVYKSLRDTPAVTRALRTGLARCPESRGLHLEEARRLNAMGQKQRALAHFQEAYRLRPSQPDPLIEMAGILFALNQPERGEAALREALVKAPSHPMAMAVLNINAINRGDQAEADHWWRRIVAQPRTPREVRERIRQAYQQKFRHAP